MTATPSPLPDPGRGGNAPPAWRLRGAGGQEVGRRDREKGKKKREKKRKKDKKRKKEKRELKERKKWKKEKRKEGEGERWVRKAGKKCLSGIEKKCKHEDILDNCLSLEVTILKNHRYLLLDRIRTIRAFARPARVLAFVSQSLLRTEFCVFSHPFYYYRGGFIFELIE